MFKWITDKLSTKPEEETTVNPMLIFINGAPRSGKDTAGDHLIENHGFTKYKMTTSMDVCLKAFFGMGQEEWDYWREHAKDDKFTTRPCARATNSDGTCPHCDPKNKGVPIPGVCREDITFRQVLISLSEDWAKPMFGDSIMGVLAADRLERLEQWLCQTFDNAKEYGRQPRIVITDCGFIEELQVLCNRYKDKWNMLFINVQRKGCTFEGDSRSDLTPPKGTPYKQMHNNGTVSMFHSQLDYLMQKLERSKQLTTNY